MAEFKEEIREEMVKNPTYNIRGFILGNEDSYPKKFNLTGDYLDNICDDFERGLVHFLEAKGEYYVSETFRPHRQIMEDDVKRLIEDVDWCKENVISEGGCIVNINTGPIEWEATLSTESLPRNHALSELVGRYWSKTLNYSDSKNR